MCNRTFILLMATIFGQTVLNAQDTIRLKNGIVLHGLITEINNKEIKFRIDGGIVPMDQLLSYQRGKDHVIVQNSPIVSNQLVQPVKPAPCEIKDVGDILFDNKSDGEVQVTVYAIGSLDLGNNPKVASITVPAKTAVTVYDMTSGIHFINFATTNNSNGRDYMDGTGQVKVTKCGTTKYEIKK
jgi:hypothetical protein